jgi:predicted ATP-dependent endonuclease of OLD family
MLNNNEHHNKQIIMITHNSEFITEDMCNNIIRFSQKNGETQCYSLTNRENEKDLKLILEHPQVLFSDKCFLVEGHYDMRVLSQFLHVIKNDHEFVVVNMLGADSCLYSIMFEFDIKYKMIFDVDKLYYKKKMLNEDFTPTKIMSLILAVLGINPNGNDKHFIKVLESYEINNFSELKKK